LVEDLLRSGASDGVLLRCGLLGGVLVDRRLLGRLLGSVPLRDGALCGGVGLRPGSAGLPLLATQPSSQPAVQAVDRQGDHEVDDRGDQVGQIEPPTFCVGKMPRKGRMAFSVLRYTHSTNADWGLAPARWRKNAVVSKTPVTRAKA
jgi:hypothetical protein